jgi:hypothetical protein
MTLVELEAQLREARLWPADKPLRITMPVIEYAKLTHRSEKSVKTDCLAGRIPCRRDGPRGLVRVLTLPALSQFFHDAGGLDRKSSA